MARNSEGRWHRALQLSTIFALSLAMGLRSIHASPADGGGAQALEQQRVPRPINLLDFVKDEGLAVALGKALFWESQVGGDGIQACATCHASAGTDARTLNTVNPGHNGVFELVAGPGQPLPPGPLDVDVDDVIGSQGVVDKSFTKINPGNALDTGVVTPNALFFDQRQVTGRNTPTFVNAVFNFENFWDGRAKNTFNGRTPGGKDPNALLLRVGTGGSVSKVNVEIRNSSLASQSVGPPNNGVEMSWEGRAFFDLGKKLLSLRPLGTQEVASDDSVLGSLRHPSGLGLSRSYADLIRGAFQGRWWDSDAVVDRALNVVRRGTPAGPDEFSVMEANFSLFWGLAIQMYASTQIAGDSPFDRFAKGNSRALTRLQQQGMNVFFGKGECSECHSGPVLTAATEAGNDEAFVDSGVRPDADDPGRSNGRFKTSTVRNTELTGPYFHNGGYGTLRQVVDFYDRGGDFPGQLDRLGLTETEKVALVAFLLSTTDDRVRFQRAPFDHPSLSLPNGASVPAVGRNGGAEVKPFLGLDPFDAGPGESAMIASDPAPAGAGTEERRLLLLSHANAGEPFSLFASAGDVPELPLAGHARQSRRELESLLSSPAITLVTTGTLDSDGTAEVVLPPEGQGRFFFVVHDSRTHAAKAVSRVTE